MELKLFRLTYDTFQKALEKEDHINSKFDMSVRNIRVVDLFVESYHSTDSGVRLYRICDASTILFRGIQTKKAADEIFEFIKAAEVLFL